MKIATAQLPTLLAAIEHLADVEYFFTSIHSKKQTKGYFILRILRKVRTTEAPTPFGVQKLGHYSAPMLRDSEISTQEQEQSRTVGDTTTIVMLRDGASFLLYIVMEKLTQEKQHIKTNLPNKNPMKTAIGIFCIVLPVVLALWPDIKKAIKK